MTLDALVYSIAGLAIGFIIGRWARYEWYREAAVMFRRNRASNAGARPSGQVGFDPNAEIPTVIPAVRFDPSTGEPLIATEEVHKPSPIPRSITIIIIILAAISLAYILYSKTHDSNVLRRANDRLAAQVAANRALLEQVQHQQNIVDGNEQRLEDLVLAISTAKTPGEVTDAIQRFLKQSANAKAREQKYQQEHGGTSVKPTAFAHPEDTGGSPSPRPQPSAAPSSRPSPRGSPSASPSGSPAPSQSPNPPVQVCVVTPLGRVCEPPNLFPST